MKTTLRFLFTICCCLCLTNLAFSQFVTETAGTTTTVMPANGDIFTDPTDGTNGGPGGDCSTTSSGDLGDYPNCNCITVTTLCAPVGEQITITFTDFRVNGNFDWLAIFDGSGPVTAINAGGSGTNPSSADPILWNSVTNGDELIDMTNAGSVTFSSTSGCLTFASRFSSVVNTCGWEATVSLSGTAAGDECATAVNLPVQVGLCASQTMGDNSAATPSGDGAPSCGNFSSGEDNWFTMMVPATGELNIEMSTAGGPTDWAMSAYSGTCGALAEIECDDDDGPGLFPTLNLTGLTPGDVVFVQVWEWGNNATGEFNICANDNSPPPAIANDNCAMATSLNVDAAAMCLSQTSGSNIGATASGELPAPSCGNFATGEDVWYSLTVPASGIVNVEMSSAGGPTDWAMSAYSGTCGALAEIECDDDDGPGLFPFLNLTGLTPNETILIRVWEWGNNSEGQFNICAFSPPCDVTITGTASTDESCFETVDGTITVTATTSNGPLTYDLTGPVNLSNATGVFTGLPPGVYNVVVTDTGVPAPCEDMTGPITVGTDVLPPVITCPPGVVGTCDNVPSPAASLAEFIASGGTVSDNCPITNIVASDLSTGTVCPTTAQATITRTYTVSDDSGNPSTCSQTITILNSTTGPVITSSPPNQTVDCAFNVMPALHLFQANTDCGLGLTTSVGDVVVVGAPNCPNTQYRYTYTAMDDCGRTADHTQIITIQNDAPELVLPPEICIIDCPADTDMIINSFNNYAQVATVITSCSDIGTTISNNFNPNGFFNQNCAAGPINGIPNVRQWQTVTFTATDPCDRTSSGSILVVITDSNPPTIEGEPYLTIRECDDNVQAQYDAWIADNIANMNATDGCSDVTWSHSPASPNEGPWVNGYAITHVVFTATDDCGNASSKDVHFKLKNNHPPTFIGNLPDLMVECTEMLPDFETPTFIHACGETTLTFEDVTIPGACAGEYSITRTWTVTDNCEGVNTTAQTITVVDNTAPVFSNVPANGMVECEEDVVFGMPTATDECSDVTITSEDLMVGDGCGGSITRTWTAMDACGNIATASQTITIEDVTAPVFTDVPTDGMVECADDAVFGMPTATDNCNDVTVTSEDLTIGDDCDGSITRTWTAMDACGNTAIASQTITINDSSAPVFSDVPAGGTVECADDVIFGMPTATDNCSDVTMTSEDLMVGDGCTGSITRTWTAMDACGNSATASATFNYSDTEAPVASNVPGDIMISCNDPIVFGPAPTWMDNCDDDVFTSFEDVTTPGGCASGMGSYTVERFWSAIDDCDNLAVVSQTITIVDNMAPVFTFVPSDITQECGNNVQFGTPTAEDDCGDVTITHEDVTMGGGCDESTTRTWTATDACGNTTTASATITITDDEAPVFTNVPETPDVNCDNIPDWEIPTVEDNCGDVDLTFEESISGDLCDDGYAWKRLWTATDACGNTAQVETVIWVNPDNEGPVFTFVPGTPDVDCDNIPDWEIPTVEDNCGDVTLTFEETVSGDLCDDGYAWKRLWTATDDCGNTSQVETVIWVNPDNDGPVFTFVPEGALINCDEFPPTFGEPEVEDACGSVTLTFITEYVTGGPQSCDNGESFDYRRVWTATDACGNETTAKQTFWVKPEGAAMGIISGHLADESNEMIESVEVEVEGAGLIGSWMTDEEGDYAFDLPTSFNYEVEPSKNDEPLNGVNTLDLILISKHILGIETLDSPYKMIAADINNSGQITGFDMVELRKLILFINTEFQGNTSWRFVESDFIFPNPTNPFETTFPEMAAINGLSGSEIVDFVGIKVGDVNGSAVANQLQAGDTRNDDALFLNVDDLKMNAGQEYQIDFRAKDFAAIQGYQFTLNFDAAALDFVDLKAGELPNLTTDNFGFHRLSEGIITTSWNERTGQSMEETAVLFSLVFKAKSTTTLSEALAINSNWTKAEAYTELGTAMDLQMEFNGAQSNTTPIFALYQNQPNPFKDETLIQFNLPEATTATLTVYDVAGRIIKVVEGAYTQGYQQLSISRSDLNHSGVYYYRLDTEQNSAVRKMILH